MIDRAHDLPITRQVEVLNISRGSVYYLPRPVPEADLAIMRRLDRLHLEFPFAGSRMLRGLLVAEGCKIGRRHVKTLMQRMGIEALYRRPRTTKPEPGHKIYPYLLRGDGDHAAEPGVGDGHHLHPDGAGLHLSRRCARLVQPPCAVVAAVDHDGSGILRRDAGGCFGVSWQAGHLQHRQGSQFTGQAFTGVLANNGIAISMDGKGAWRDNLFVERLWRSVKYEEVYLKAYDSVSEARASIGRYLGFYNGRRPHSSLDGSTPDQAYFTPLPIRLAA
jgi:putative transposase